MTVATALFSTTSAKLTRRVSPQIRRAGPDTRRKMNEGDTRSARFPRSTGLFTPSACMTLPSSLLLSLSILLVVVLPWTNDSARQNSRKLGMDG